ncbi:MAG: extracellular solute-binding protein [Treponema sp.]|jgi:multiple sugar transport system substrate-binding protein|nr:extracellular solute-binding protein [Treponema sp.]
MAVKPADRLLFVIALAACGIALVVTLLAPGDPEPPAGPEALSLALYLAEDSGLAVEDLELLIAGYSRADDNADDASQIEITINAEDRAPDILIAGGQSLAAGIGAGLYLPLDRFDAVGSLPFAAAGNWALPLVSAMDVFVYNIPLLQEAGFDRPPRTRGDVLSYARAVKALDGGDRTQVRRYALALGLSPLDPRGLGRDVYSWFYTSGLLLPTGGKPEFGGRDYTQTLEFFSTLNNEGLIAPGSFIATGAERVEEFVRGSVAMMIVSARDLRYIRGKLGEALGISLVPHADTYAGRPVFGLATWYAAISAAGPHPDESWTLLRYLRERSAFLAESLALVPGTGVYNPYIPVDPLLDKAWGLYEAAELVPDFTSPGAPGDPDGAFRRELDRLFRSSVNAEEAAQAIRQSWEQ